MDWQGAPVGSSRADKCRPLCADLLDQLNLAADIEFILDAVGDQVVVGGVRLLMLARAAFHCLKELVGERFHDEREAWFAARVGWRRGLRTARQ